MDNKLWFKAKTSKDVRPTTKNILWFRVKTYGYGWTPNTWQGWVVILLYAFALIGLCTNIRMMSDGDGNLLVNFVFPFLVLTTFLIIICLLKGEKARWRWGNDK